MAAPKKRVKTPKPRPPGGGTRAEGELFSLFNGVHVPILVFAHRQNRTAVTFANEAAESLLGFTPRQLRGMRFSDLFDPSVQAQAAAIEAILQAPSGRSLVEEPEMKVIRRSRRRVTVKVTASTLVANGERLMILCLSDLTEQKRLQDERENAFKEVMRISKLADIGQLVAGVAHELNNPLTVIQGFAENIELLLDEENEPPREELKVQLDPILKATDRMAKIISRMMRMVRQDDIRMTGVDLRDVVADALHFMHHRLDDFGITLINDLPEALEVRCDPNQIEQILLNLISNAVHALRKNEGERRIQVSAELAIGSVLLKVANNGPPIPAEIRDRIMSPFFTTKPVGEGTGLGLALSYGIMKAHGGDLRFTSSKADGTEFILEFPRANENSNDPPSIGSGRAILVADDNDLVRQGLAAKFARYGYNVLEARDGEELLLLARTCHSIECVIVELYMPRTTPSLLIGDLRRHLPRALLYVLSDAPNKPGRELAALRQGINGVIGKPVDQETFASILQHLESRPRAA